MDTIKVRNIVFGEGVPKTFVPIVERKEANVLTLTKQIAESSADCVEFRADFYEHCEDVERLVRLVRMIREMIGDKVLLYTFRSDREGGQVAITTERYKQMITKICKSGLVDLVDVEGFREEGLLREMCDVAHENGVYVVASNHDFNKTPSEEEMARRLIHMERWGADIPKIAVMPQSKRDVLELLGATLRYYENGGNKPIITMSMGAIGGVSRFTGELFGSCATFATIGKASAPGQMELGMVEHIMTNVHKYL